MAPLVYNASTQACVCTADVASACDDDDVCTVDGCDPTAGCTHTPISCDDGVSCTVDTCDPATGCTQTLDTGLCTCTDLPLPPVEAHPSLSVDLGSVACPGGGGQIGASVEFAADGTLQLPGCGNECTGYGSLTASATATLELCSGRNISLSQSANFGQTRAYVSSCDEATCRSGCGDGYCRTDEMSGSVAGSVSQFYGQEFGETAPGGVMLSARCGGTIGGSLSVGGDLTAVSNNGDTRGTCVDCRTSDLGLSLGQSASIDCDVKLGFRGAALNVGCKNCLAADWRLSGNTTGSSGSCGNDSCDRISLTVGAHMNSPKVKVNVGWWGVEVAGKASLTACEEANSCGTCTCGGGSCMEFTPKLSMVVCGGHSNQPMCL